MRILILLLVLISTTTLAQGKSKQKHIQIVTEDWPPFNYALPNGQIGGISSVKVKQIFAMADIPYTITLHPWLKAFEQAKNNQNVMIYSILRSKEREDQFKWICPLTQPVTLFYFSLSHRDDIDLVSLRDIDQYTIGVTASEYSHHFLQKKISKDDSNIRMSNSSPDNLQKLLTGEVDIIIETLPSIKLRLKAVGKDYSAVKSIIEVRNDDISPNCMAFGLKTSDEIVERVRRALLRLNAQQAAKYNDTNHL